MLVDAGDKVAGDAGVKRTAEFAGQDIDAEELGQGGLRRWCEK